MKRLQCCLDHRTMLRKIVVAGRQIFDFAKAIESVDPKHFINQQMRTSLIKVQFTKAQVEQFVYFQEKVIEVFRVKGTFASSD